MRTKTLLVVAVATVVVALAAVLSQTNDERITGSGELVFPALLDKLNDTVEVAAASRGEAFTLKRDGSRWVVAEKLDYPADQLKVRQLLLGIAQLKRIEPKTSTPELYAKIGLGDTSDKDSAAVRYTLKDAGGDALADVVIGNDRFARGDPDANEYYVREPDEPQTWLVLGRLPDAKSALAWLDQSVLKIDRERVHRVQVRHADGAEVTVRKHKPSDTDYELVDMPEGMEPDGVWKLNDMGKAMAEMELADVLRAADAPQGEPAYVAETVTFDGLRVVLRAVRDGERTLATLQASFDGSAVAIPSGDEGGQDPREAEARAKLAGADQVREEAEQLNARWRDWVYVIPPYRAGYLSKKREELLKPSEAKPAS